MCIRDRPFSIVICEKKKGVIETQCCFELVAFQVIWAKPSIIGKTSTSGKRGLSQKRETCRETCSHSALLRGGLFFTWISRKARKVNSWVSLHVSLTTLTLPYLRQKNYLIYRVRSRGFHVENTKNRVLHYLYPVSYTHLDVYKIQHTHTLVI